MKVHQKLGQMSGRQGFVWPVVGWPLSCQFGLRIVVSFLLGACGETAFSVSAQGQAAAPPAARPASADDPVLNLNTQLVSLTVTVADKEGRHWPSLLRQAFTVYEDDVRQELSFFAPGDVPASVAVVFDLSGSMRPEKFQRAQLALERFLQNCHPEDEFSLVGFNEKAWLAVERTRDGEQLLRQFRLSEPKGHTALYDAVALGLQQLARSSYARRVLLLVSDGEDNRSRASYRDIKRQVQESAALLYAIGITDYALKHSQGEFLLDELAKQSGGKAFFPRDGEAMSAAFEKIALELRQQYSLGYTPTNFVADGKWRKLKVKVAQPAGAPLLVVRARSGYYANPPRSLVLAEAEGEGAN